jgi:hypothetical protein
MTLQRGYLALNADADKDGTMEDGVFELVGNLEVNERMHVDHLFGNELGNINSVTTSLPGWVGTEAANKLNSSRVGFFLDLGAGRHIFEINAVGWESPSEPYFWGDPTETSVGNGGGQPSNAGAEIDADGNITAAGNTNSMQQMAVLMQYLQYGEYDSRQQAGKLYFGEYYPDKSDRPDWMDDSLPDTPFEDFKHVTVQRASINRNAENPKSFDISVFVQETEDMTGPIDVVTQVEF